MLVKVMMIVMFGMIMAIPNPSESLVTNGNRRRTVNRKMRRKK